ncbi:Thiol-disulfide isomerase or thioredoxin [Pedobacter soli]|uniref:Thiol-disulfide isomerase or thioredoxin n=2 Tax=Pedobacter soli TaxID=390242 RepID=A0A1G6WX43_9SPHI|nr:Thiol-disulfide isomerase or thioredoxin [Pedobacter soli]
MTETSREVLKIGDKVPESFWNTKRQFLIEGKSTDKSLEHLRGKLIVIDFWATWCAPCVAMMPSMENLQKQFSDEIQILPVTAQLADIVNGFLPLQEAKTGVKFNLPKIVSDRSLAALFPHNVIPHLVWIDKQGILRATTGFEEATSAKIKQMITGDLKDLRTKTDVFLAFDKEKPLFMNENGGDGRQMIFHSVLSAYVPGIHPGFNRNQDSLSGFKILVRNNSAPKILAYAFGEGKREFNRKNTVYNISDSSVFSRPKNEDVYEWMRKHTYCYELVVPPHLSIKAYDIMKSELKTLFPNYNCRIEKRKLNCLVLLRTKKVDMKSIGGEAIAGFNPFGFKIQNANLSILALQLDMVYMQDAPLVLDKTGIDYNVDIEVKSSLKDRDELNRNLEKYGLRLEEKKVFTQVLVISEQEGRQNEMEKYRRTN